MAKILSYKEKTKKLIQSCLFQEPLMESLTTLGWLGGWLALLSAQVGS